jgi:hypothetical protein
MLTVANCTDILRTPEPAKPPVTPEKGAKRSSLVYKVPSHFGLMEGEDNPFRLYDSFVRPYVGEAVDNFFDYLASNNNKFSARLSRSYYGKFCSIVQSSGTGKSRLLTEVRLMSVSSYSVAQHVNLAPEKRCPCPLHEHS